MPTYGGTPVLTVGKFNQARKAVNEWFTEHAPGGDLPTPYKPGHEGHMYVLTHEGDPSEWAIRASEELRDAVPGVFFEAVRGSCLAMYPAHTP